MYESHYACHFFRLWGGKDFGQPNKAKLLGNMQNPFDGFFGDINGDVNKRYFIIEFKLERKGIWDEVKSKKEKPHRNALFKKLFSNESSRMLSHVGHFAAYEEQKNLRLEPYVDASIPEKKYAADQEKILVKIDNLKKLNTLPQGFRIVGRTISFDAFHSLITESDNSISSEFPNFYKYGLGWTRQQLSQYVTEEMYGHLVQGKVKNNSKTTDSDTEVLMLGMHNENGEFKAVIGNVEEIIEKLHMAFEEMAKTNAAKP
jgi:predicted transcriptional regulator YdeE